MASFVSGQDESNPALWLAARAGKMEPSCPLGTTRRVPQEKLSRKPHNKSFTDQACSVKMAGYWPRSFFCVVMDLDSVSVHTYAKEKEYPAILTSHLVNNPYILLDFNFSANRSMRYRFRFCRSVIPALKTVIVNLVILPGSKWKFSSLIPLHFLAC